MVVRALGDFLRTVGTERPRGFLFVRGARPGARARAERGAVITLSFCP